MFELCILFSVSIKIIINKTGIDALMPNLWALRQPYRIIEREQVYVMGIY